MRLTVLGNAGDYLAPLSGGSSYLLEHEGARILLDAGQGAREALLGLGGAKLDAIWVSHMHFDHVLDLATLGAAAQDAPILLPRGERRRLDALADAYVWRRGFDLGGGVREVEEGDALDLAGLRWTFARTQHSAPALAARFEAEGASLVYASDTAACDGLRRLAQGADVLLMHALLPDVEAASDHARIHATARSAGALAAEVGARRLLLSHRFFESRDEDMLREARASFGDTSLTRTGASHAVP